MIVVNGHEYPLPEPRTLGALMRLISPAVPYAVARNAEMVPRGAYEECRIEPGDSIDIVHPAAGG